MEKQLKVTQSSKIALVCSYLRVPQDAGQVKIDISSENYFYQICKYFVMLGKCLF